MFFRFSVLVFSMIGSIASGWSGRLVSLGCVAVLFVGSQLAGRCAVSTFAQIFAYVVMEVVRVVIDEVYGTEGGKWEMIGGVVIAFGAGVATMLGFALMVGPASFGIVFKDSVLLAILLTFRRMISDFSGDYSYNYLTCGAEADTTSIRDNLKKDADAVQGTYPSEKCSMLSCKFMSELSSGGEENTSSSQGQVDTGFLQDVSTTEEPVAAHEDIKKCIQCVEDAESLLSRKIISWKGIEKTIWVRYTKYLGLPVHNQKLTRDEQISKVKKNIKSAQKLVLQAKKRSYDLFSSLNEVFTKIDQDLTSAGVAGNMVLICMSLKNKKEDLNAIKCQTLDALDYKILHYEISHSMDDSQLMGVLKHIDSILNGLISGASGGISVADDVKGLCKEFIEKSVAMKI